MTLKEAIANKGVEQQFAAREMGVSVYQLSRYAGGQLPSFRDRRKINAYLGDVYCPVCIERAEAINGELKQLKAKPCTCGDTND